MDFKKLDEIILNKLQIVPNSFLNDVEIEYLESFGCNIDVASDKIYLTWDN